MQLPQFIAVTSLVLICTLVGAHAEKRVALVIGNDHYANLPAHEQLQKAVNDARAVGGALEQLGFEVLSGENLRRQELVDKLDMLSRRLSSGDTAFFFFSGHGVVLNGANYILPTDVPNVEADQETRLARAALSEHDIVQDLQSRGVRIAVVVLDACRNNPFHPVGTKSVGGAKGLAPPEPVHGVFSLYAAANGQTALDRLYDGDKDPNSVFTRVLAPALRRPGMDLATLSLDVREEVARLARTVGHDQRPAYYDETIGGRVYLAGSPPVDGAKPSLPLVGDAAERAWLAVQNSDSIAVLEEFRRQYAGSAFDGFAVARIEELRKKQLVVAALSSPPLAASSTPSPTSAHRFDGIWNTSIVCDGVRDVGGWSYSFFSNVKNSELQAETGVEGKPGWVEYRGTIESDGRIEIRARGLANNPKVTLNHLASGTPFGWRATGRFNEVHGNVTRVEGRPCRLEFVKQVDSDGARTVPSVERPRRDR